MNIVFNVDDKYVPHMCVTMLSILKNTQNDVVVFHILTTSLSTENREYIESLVGNTKHNVCFYYLSEDILGNVFLGEKTANKFLTFAAFLRLTIPSVLPQNVDKVLYLDCDIVVVDNLLPLWNVDISEVCVAAYCEHIEELSKRLGYYNETDYYFNSGVMLMNVKKMREISFFEKAKTVILERRKELLFHDQDVLNILLHSDVLPIEQKWNMIYLTEMKPGLAVIHFAGYKPWNTECMHPLKYLYWEYLNQTKFAGMKPAPRYSWIERMRRKVSKFVKRYL